MLFDVYSIEAVLIITVIIIKSSVENAARNSSCNSCVGTSWDTALGKRQVSQIECIEDFLVVVKIEITVG